MLKLQDNRYIHVISRIAAAAALALFIGACGDDDTTTNPPTTNTSTTLSEGEVLHVAMTINQGEVMTNQPAVSKATNDTARRFAQHMVTEHTMVAQRTDSVARARGVTLGPNQVSTTLDNVARGVASKLNTLSGAAFDSVYIDAQITMHHQALDMLDFTLIPNAASDQSRTFLTQMRASVAMHLTEAKMIKEMMR